VWKIWEEEVQENDEEGNPKPKKASEEPFSKDDEDRPLRTLLINDVLKEPSIK